jgi:hypothetical protein
MKSKVKITAKKVGKANYMGRADYQILINNKVVLSKYGQVELWKAFDEKHAIACFKQFNEQYA